ncbi:MAG: transposase [Candidatus Vogelbacteria bacterium]|nr:transposase [Candidatus Vogelbacteria bacterium]
MEKRDIFMNDGDRFRFLRSMYFCNDIAPAVNSFRDKNEFDETMNLDIEHKSLVRIHSFVLMPNHFHFLIEPLNDSAITVFMHKLGTAYTMYFNKKHRRVGSLFQGPFKAISVKNEAYFNYLPYYIHLNPLDLSYPSWREQKLKDYNNAFKFLNEYRWSSYLDYIGVKNYPSIIYRDLLLEILGNPLRQKGEMKEWLKNMSFDVVADLTFENDVIV